jgi:hypothetical protein
MIFWVGLISLGLDEAGSSPYPYFCCRCVNNVLIGTRNISVKVAAGSTTSVKDCLECATHSLHATEAPTESLIPGTFFIVLPALPQARPPKRRRRKNRRAGQTERASFLDPDVPFYYQVIPLFCERHWLYIDGASIRNSAKW